MKKLILIITMLVLMLVSEACGQAYEAMRGTSVDTFSIGNKYWFELFRDKDSSWVKVRMSINGKDSILVFTDTTKVKKLIGIESKIREDADGNLLAHILLKANVTSVDSVKNRLSSAESSILLKAGRDELENAKDSLWAEIDLLAAIMESDTTSIEYALSQIELKANKTYVDSTKNNLQSSIDLLTAAVEEDSASIDYAMAQIGLKSNKTYVDSTKANLEAQIALSATIGSVDTLNNRLEYAVGQLSAKANTTKLDSVRNQIMAEVYLRARASYVDTIKVIQDTIRYEQDELIERVSIAEAGITANANQIVDAQGDIIDIQASLFLYAQKNNIISYINISPEEIKISSDKITFNGEVVASSLLTESIEALSYTTYSGYPAQSTMTQSGFSIHGNVGDDAGQGFILGRNGSRATITGANAGNRGLDVAGNITANGSEVITVAEISSYALTIETDPNVPLWAKEATKPSYTYSEVGAAASSHTHSEYLTAETDPNVPSHVKNITSQNIADWNWASGVVDALHNIAISGNYNELNNVPTTFAPTTHGNESHSDNYITASSLWWDNINGKPTSFNPNTHGNEAHSAVYLTSETDPSVPTHVKSITSQNITDWNWASAVVDNLAQVAISGSYNDLSNKPDLSSYATQAWVISLIQSYIDDHVNLYH